MRNAGKPWPGASRATSRETSSEIDWTQRLEASGLDLRMGVFRARTRDVLTGFMNLIITSSTTPGLATEERRTSCTCPSETGGGIDG